MTDLNTLPILEFTTSELFESWMENNENHSKGIWLRIFKKQSSIETITYAEALDVCLWYGWIDAQKKSYDA